MQAFVFISLYVCPMYVYVLVGVSLFDVVEFSQD